MTQEQKTLILHYREQHMTYRQIGEKLGLSPDTVKTFCRRNSAQADRHGGERVKSQCRNCGAPVHPLPGRTGAPVLLPGLPHRLLAEA